MLLCATFAYCLHATSAFASNENKSLYLVTCKPSSPNCSPKVVEYNNATYVKDQDFDLGDVHGISFTRSDVSCRKTTAAAIYVSCKTKYQDKYESCGHGGNSGFAYLSFGSFRNPACPAAMYFGFFDDLEKLPETPQAEK